MQVREKFSIPRKVPIFKIIIVMLTTEVVYLRMHLSELSIYPPLIQLNIKDYDIYRIY